MTRLTIAQAQSSLTKILTGLHHPPLGSAAAFMEEAGEVAKVLVDHHCYGRPFDREALEGELADAFVCLAELASLHGIDLGVAVAEKIKDIGNRAPKWRATLGPSLKNAWTVPHGPGAHNPDLPEKATNARKEAARRRRSRA